MPGDSNDGSDQRIPIEGERWQGHAKLDPRLTAFLEMSQARLANWAEAEALSVEPYETMDTGGEYRRARFVAVTSDGANAESTMTAEERASTEASANPDNYDPNNPDATAGDAEMMAAPPTSETGIDEQRTESPNVDASGAPTTESADATTTDGASGAPTVSPDGATATGGDSSSGDATSGTGGETPTGTSPASGGTLEDEAAGFRVQPSPVLHGLSLADEPRARVFVRFAGDPERLRALGVTIRSSAGDIHTADVPIRLLYEMDQHPDVQFVELSRPLKRTLDESVPVIQADKLHTAACAAADPTTVLCPLRPPGAGEVDCAVTGKGVLVGIVDTGLDFRHPDFWDAVGNTVRVRGIWDQGVGLDPAFPPPTGYTYGRYYPRSLLNDDINSGDFSSVVPYRAPEGAHATHVAGILAGNGAVEPAWTGVAPGAEILFVECKQSNTRALADMVELAEAINFIFTEAGTTPCVVNVSLGDNLGPHDGTSLVEAYIDNLLDTPGRAVVIAAGNATQQYKHTFSTLIGAAQDVLVTVPNTLANRIGESLELWYDAADRMDLTITIPNPAGGSFVLGPITPGVAITYTVDAKLEVIVHSRVADARNGDNVIIVMLQPLGDRPILPGTWTFSLRPEGGVAGAVKSGAWNAWIDHNTVTASSNGVTFAGGATASCTLTTPGTSRLAITVGNHKTTSGQPIHETSGVGPTRDGRIKPEITAPGTTIAACKAVDWWKDSNNDGIPDVPTGFYTNKDGTSMSTPHVAGAVALLFEGRDANLSAADAKYILQRLADTTGITTPSPVWGWGRLRLANALCWVETQPDVWCKTAPDDTGVEPYTGARLWMSPDIWVRPNRDGGTTHENPVFGQENHVHVRVRNRGAGPAFNVRVFLYWADPGTDIPLSRWQESGIGVAGESGNVQVIAQLDAGAELVLPVPFSWRPPEPGTTLAGDNHFCLLVRLECDIDPASVGVGGWDAVRLHNNVALKNVHIVDTELTSREAGAGFWIGGAKGSRSLGLDLSEVPSLVVPTFRFPAEHLDLLSLISALPVTVLPLVRKFRKSALPADRAALMNALEGRVLNDKTLKRFSFLHGVQELRFESGQAVLTLERGAVLLDRLIFTDRAKARLELKGLQTHIGSFHTYVEERVDGALVGGVTTLFRDRLRSLPLPRPGIRSALITVGRAVFGSSNP